MTADNLTALLRAREEELSAIYENVSGVVFYIAVEPDGEFRFLSVSRDFLSDTGLSREQVVGSLVRDVIPPTSRDMVLNNYREAIRSGQPVRWEEKSMYPVGPRYGGILVFAEDITQRKQMEEELSHMSRKLIESQEQERSRIGRELHDDVSQRLALLNVELEQLQENPSEFAIGIQELQKQ